MGRKGILERGAIVSGSNQMTASWTSNKVDTVTFDGGSVVFVWSGSAGISGSLQPYGGQDVNIVDPSNNQGAGGSDLPRSKNIAWFPWTQGFTPTPPYIITGSSGVVSVAFQFFPYKWLQWQYTCVTAATGSMTGSMYGKTVGA